MLTTTEQTAVEKGRTIIDDYRKAHGELKPAEQGVAFGKLLNDLYDLKLSEKDYPFNVFFEKSRQYNYEALGFTDKADYEAKATAQDKASLSSMWK